VEIERIEYFLGQLVLKCKAKVSRDDKKRTKQNVLMAKDEDIAATEYRAFFISRVKEARKKRGLTQVELAALLGLDQGTYKQYETRSFLPHVLIHRFCLACDVHCDWLFGAAAAPARVQKRQSKKIRAA
jgi:DNA-binding XRE family transcriptional regulator